MPLFMGSEAPPPRIPVINFPPSGVLKPGTPEWESIKFQVVKALEEYGCFEALFDKVALDLRKSVFSSLKELFDLPLERKMKNSSKKPFHGYHGKIPRMLPFESLGIDDAPILEKVQGFTDILWPEGNPKFCETIQSYSEKLSELDQIIRTMIVESYGVEKHFDELIDLTNHLLRVMKYNVDETTTDGEAVGLLPHTDMNLLTILCQNHVNGLAVQTKDGEWIDVIPSVNSFTVFSGDAFHAWTNGRLHSPKHRVILKGNEARYSAGLFAIPKSGHIIKAPEELVDEEHPLLFKPYDHVKFLGYFYVESQDPDKIGISALKTYCGA